MSFERKFLHQFRIDLPPPMKIKSIERKTSFRDAWKRKFSSIKKSSRGKIYPKSKRAGIVFSEDLKPDSNFVNNVETPSFCNNGLENTMPVIPNYSVIQLHNSDFNLPKKSLMSSFNGEYISHNDDAEDKREYNNKVEDSRPIRKDDADNPTNFYGVETKTFIRTNYSCRMSRSFRKGQHSYSAHQLPPLPDSNNADVTMRNNHNCVHVKRSASKRMGFIDCENKFSSNYASTASLPVGNMCKPKIPSKPRKLSSRFSKKSTKSLFNDGEINNNSETTNPKGYITKLLSHPEDRNNSPALDNCKVSQNKKISDKLISTYNVTETSPPSKGYNPSNYQLISYGINISDITNLKLRHVSRGIDVSTY